MSTDETPSDPQETSATPTATEAPAPSTPADDDPWPFDDDGTFRVKPRPEDLDWPFASDAPEREPLAFGVADELPLDAFEKAVSQAVHVKLGAPTPPTAKPGGARSADELVASVLGALSGKDAATALHEVREQLAAQGGARPKAPEPRGAEVIDLAAVRAARQRPPQPEAAGQLGNALRDTFQSFLAQYAGLTGQREVKLDADFLRQNGNALIGSLFQGLAEALMPQVAPKMGTPAAFVPAPAATPEELAALDAADLAAEEAASSAAHNASPPQKPAENDAETAAQAPANAAPHAPDVAAKSSLPSRISPDDVKITVDLASIFASLFKRRPKA